jgi:pSer/pThr/pTyr-binding forkhead associated (FHA) protein
MQATLVLNNPPPNATRKIYLAQFPVVLGRSQDADVHIPGPLVSRSHCTIEVKEGTLIVKDLGSCNGTLVNGCHVNEAPLLPGDHLTLGAYVLRVAYERSSLAPTPPIIYGRPADASLMSEETGREQVPNT